MKHMSFREVLERMKGNSEHDTPVHQLEERAVCTTHWVSWQPARIYGGERLAIERIGCIGASQQIISQSLTP